MWRYMILHLHKCNKNTLNMLSCYVYFSVFGNTHSFVCFSAPY